MNTGLGTAVPSIAMCAYCDTLPDYLSMPLSRPPFCCVGVLKIENPGAIRAYGFSLENMGATKRMEAIADRRKPGKQSHNAHKQYLKPLSLVYEH